MTPTITAIVMPKAKTVAQAIADAWPDAELVSTTGLGHRRILDDVGVVEQAVDFIRRAPTDLKDR